MSVLRPHHEGVVKIAGQVVEIAVETRNSRLAGKMNAGIGQIQMECYSPNRCPLTNDDGAAVSHDIEVMCNSPPVILRP
jgi:hypothetical protein